MGYTSDDLIASVKRKASTPDSQALWQSADFLAVADEETRSYLLPLVRRAKEDYYLQTADFPLVSTAAPEGQAFRIPYRAVGGALRAVHLLNSNGRPLQCPRLDPSDLEQADWGVYFLANQVFYVDRTSYAAPVTLRMTYYLRPSALVLSANAAKVASWDFDAKTITLDQVPASYSGCVLWDVLAGRPGFEMMCFDFPGSLDIPSKTITFADDLPPDLALGDYVCRAEETPVPQIPAELHPLLAERVAWRCLLSLNDSDAAAQVERQFPRMEADALVLISQRIEGTPKKILPRGTPWRRWRR